MVEDNRAADVTFATCVIKLQIKLSCVTVARPLPDHSDVKAIVPNVLRAYWTNPNTQSGKSKRSNTRPRSPADTAPPASVKSISRYTSDAMKVEITEFPTAKIVLHRL